MLPHEGQPVIRDGAPLESSRGAVIMIHGRGATPQDILTLVPAIDRPTFTYIAPAAAGRSWYPYSFLTDTAENEPGLSSALTTFARLVDEIIAAGHPAERIVLLGFSQGACLAQEFAVRNARKYGGVIGFSGGLIGPPGTVWNHPGSFDGMPVFLGCSDVDPHIPLERVEVSAEVFSRMGAEVTKRIYRGMGHTVSADEIMHARNLLDRVG